MSAPVLRPLGTCLALLLMAASAGAQAPLVGGPETTIPGTPVMVSESQMASAPTDLSFGWLQFDSAYTSQMLDFQNRQSDKELFILEHALIEEQGTSFTLGAQFRGSAIWGTTNSADKFPYLGRFPTDFVGTTATDLRLLQANQNVTLHLNRSVHGYFETLFSDVFTFPTHNQGSYQVRQAYLVFGDLSRSPFYGFLGKKNVNFGDMGTLSPFTQAVPWHYFAPLAEGGGIGFDNQIVNATITALNGSRGIRVVDSQEKGHLNNFAANLLFRLPVGNVGQLNIGAGYLHGTIYNAAVAEHTDSDLFGPNNGAWDVNALLRFGRLRLAGEYVQTVDPWPATDHEVIAYRTEASLESWLLGRPARHSVSWSEGIQGPPGSPFEFNQQLVLGTRVDIHPNVGLTLEYVRSMGFAPLINIQRVSDPDVVQNSVVWGAVISL